MDFHPRADEFAKLHASAQLVATESAVVIHHELLEGPLLCCLGELAEAGAVKIGAGLRVLLDGHDLPALTLAIVGAGVELSREAGLAFRLVARADSD